MKKILFVMTLLLIPSLAYAEEPAWITAEGASYQGEMDTLKEVKARARHDAQSRAVEMAVGTFLNCGRTSVSPAARSRMAASRWPSKAASTAVNCQPGEGLRVHRPYRPPKKRTSSITLPVS